MKNTVVMHVSTIQLSQRKRINVMFEFIVFCILFGVFMLRAYMFDWKSIFSSFNDDTHAISFLIFMGISFGILLTVMIVVTNVKTRLGTEYKGIYVTPAEFCAGIGRDKVSAAKFSENVKCETDAD